MKEGKSLIGNNDWWLQYSSAIYERKIFLTGEYVAMFKYPLKNAF
jgi:hypothetical protein